MKKLLLILVFILSAIQSMAQIDAKHSEFNVILISHVNSLGVSQDIPQNNKAKVEILYSAAPDHTEIIIKQETRRSRNQPVRHLKCLRTKKFVTKVSDSEHFTDYVFLTPDWVTAARATFDGNNRLTDLIVYSSNGEYKHYKLDNSIY